MFKGLKNKLEEKLEEAKTYSEQVVAQVGQYRSATSDAGSEGGASISRRFLNSVIPQKPLTEQSEDTPKSSAETAIMSEVAEGDLLGLDVDSTRRARRLSGDSTHSNESTFSSFFAPVSALFGNTLERIPSDNESTCSDAFSRTTPDSTNGSIQQLQKRLGAYKAKYREAVKKYNSAVDDNERCRTLLVKSQDEMIEKVSNLREQKKMLSERLRQLSEKHEDVAKEAELKLKIEEYKKLLDQCRVKIKQLTEKHEKQDQSEVTRELHDRIAKIEEEWTKRMDESDSQHAIVLATTKAEMHAALESKDLEIEKWRRNCATLEKQDGEANSRWQQKVDQLQQIVTALETEKNDMVDKLSEAKQQGVKLQAVQEEEESRRSELEERLREVETAKIEEIRKLEEENENLRLRITEMEQSDFEKEELAARVDSIQECRGEEELMRLSDELRKVTDERDKANETLEALKNETQKVLQASREQYHAARHEADAVREKYEQVVYEMEQLSDAEFQSKEAESSMVTTIEQFEKDILALKCKSEELTQLLSEEKNRTAELVLQRDVMQVELEKATELAERHKKLCMELEEAKTARNEIEQRLIDVSSKAEKLQLELRNDRQDFEEEKREKYDVVDLEKNKVHNEGFVAQINSLAAELKSATDENEKLQVQLAAEKERLQTAFAEKSAIEQRGETSSKEVALKLLKFETQTAELFDEITSSNKEKGKLLENEKQSQEKIKELQLELANLRSANKVLDEKVTISTENVRLSYDAKVSELESEIKNLKDTLDETLHRENDKNTENVVLLQSLRERENKLSESFGLKDAVESELHELRSKFESLQKQLNSERLFVEDQTVLRKTITEQSEELAKQNETIGKLESRLSQIGKEKSSKDEEAEEIREKLLQAKQIVSTSETTNEALNELVQSLRNELASLESSQKDDRAANESLNAQLQDVNGEVESLKAEKETLAKEIATRKAEVQLVAEQIQRSVESESACRELDTEVRLRELSDVNEKMRLEFLAKEKVIEDLRAEFDQLQKKNSDQTTSSEAQISALQEQLESEKTKVGASEKKCTNLTEELNKLKTQSEKGNEVIATLQGSLDELKSELESARKKEKKDAANRDSEKEEERRLRETFALELDKMNTTVEEAIKQSEKYKEEIEKLREELQAANVEHQKAKEAAINDMKIKAEKRLCKIKTTSDEKSALQKAEFDSQMEQLTKRLRETERKLDDSVVEKAKLEQKITFLDTQKDDLEKLQENKNKTKNMLEDEKKRSKSIEAELRVAEKTAKCNEQQKEKLQLEIGTLEATVQNLRADVERLTAANESKTARQENESRKIIRELQKEVKQLYGELNEKTQQFDSSKTELDKLRTEIDGSKKGSTNGVEEETSSEYLYKEEIESLRQKLQASLSESDQLRQHLNRQEEVARRQVQNNSNASPPQKQKGSMKLNNKRDDLHGIADAAEAEYLKNVLYRYMTEREALGKDSVTLARVIGTVARFDEAQMKDVITSEESRVASWATAVGGTMSQAFTRT